MHKKVRAGCFQITVIVYGIERFEFRPDDSEDVIKGCSLIYSDNTYDKSDSKLGYFFQKQTIPINLFNKFDQLPKIAILEYEISTNTKYGAKLARFYV